MPDQKNRYSAPEVAHATRVNLLRLHPEAVQEINSYSDDELLKVALQREPGLAESIDWPMGLTDKWSRPQMDYKALAASGVPVKDVIDAQTFGPNTRAISLQTNIGAAPSPFRSGPVADADTDLAVGAVSPHTSALLRVPAEAAIAGVRATNPVIRAALDRGDSPLPMEGTRKLESSAAMGLTAGVIPAVREADRAASVPGTDAEAIIGQLGGMVAGMMAGGAGINIAERAAAKGLAFLGWKGSMAAAREIIKRALVVGGYGAANEAGRIAGQQEMGGPQLSGPRAAASMATQAGINVLGGEIGANMVPMASKAGAIPALIQRGKAAALEGATNAGLTAASTYATDAIGGTSTTPEERLQQIKLGALMGVAGGAVYGPSGLPRSGKVPTGDTPSAAPSPVLDPRLSEVAAKTAPWQPVPDVTSPIMPNGLKGTPDPFDPSAPLATGDPFFPKAAADAMVPPGVFPPPYLPGSTVDAMRTMQPLRRPGTALAVIPPAEVGPRISNPNWQKVGEGVTEVNGAGRVVSVPQLPAAPPPAVTSTLHLPVVMAIDAAAAGHPSAMRTLLQEGMPEDMLQVLGIQRADKANLSKGILSTRLKELRSHLEEGPFSVIGKWLSPDSGVWEALPGQSLSSAFWSSVASGARQLQFNTPEMTQRIHVSPRWRWSLAASTGAPLESVIPQAVQVTFPGQQQAVSALANLEAGNIAGGLSPEYRYLGGLGDNPSATAIGHTRALWEGLQTHAAPSAVGGSEVAFLYQPPLQQRLAQLNRSKELSITERIERDHLAGMGVLPTVPAVVDMAMPNGKIWRIDHLDMDPAARVAQTTAKEFQDHAAAQVATAQQLVLKEDTPAHREALRTALTAYWGAGTKIPALDVQEHILTRIAMAARAGGAETLVMPSALEETAKRLAKKWGVTTRLSGAKVARPEIALPLPTKLGDAAKGTGFVTVSKLPKMNMLIPALVGPMASFGRDLGWLTDEQETALDAAALVATGAAFFPQVVSKIATHPKTLAATAGASIGALAGGGWGGFLGAALGASGHFALSRAAMERTPLGNALDSLHATHEVAKTFDHTPAPRISVKDALVQKFQGSPEFPLGRPLTEVGRAEYLRRNRLSGETLTKGALTPEAAITFGSPVAAPYGDLRAVGPETTKAIRVLKNFNRREGEVSGHTASIMQHVYGDMRSFDQIDLFHRLVMAGDRIERAQQRILAGEPAPIEQLSTGGRKFTLPELQAYYKDLIGLVNNEPSVKTALGRYKAVMKDFGDQMVARGWMSPEALKNHQAYFHNVVLLDGGSRKGYTLNELKGSGMGGTNPVRPSMGSYAQAAHGAELPTFHNVDEVIAYYTAMMQHDALKDDMVKGLSALYGPGSALGQAIKAKTGEDYATIPWRQPGGKVQEVTLPLRIAKEVSRIYAPLPWQVVLGKNFTTSMKGWILKGSGIPMLMRNVMTDWWNVFSATPSGDKGGLLRAGLDTISDQRTRLSGAPPKDPKVRAIMDDILKEGTGAGSAIGDASDTVSQAPHTATIRIDPRTSALMRARQGAGETGLWMNYAWNQARNLQEGIGRNAYALKEVVRLAGGMDNYLNATPEQRERVVRLAASNADDVAVSYSDITHAQKNLFKGMLAPFATWFIKTGQSYAPFITHDVNSGTRLGWNVKEESPMIPGTSIQRPHRNQIAAQKLAMSLAAGMITLAWNESQFPEVEATLPEYKRTQPHILVWNPFDQHSVVYLGVPGPLNTVAGFVGAQGLVRRVADDVMGRTDVSDEVQTSMKDAWENWASVLNPLITTGYMLGTGKDLRSGQPVIDVQAPWQDQLGARFQGVLKMLPFVSQTFRGASQTAPGADSFGHFLYQMTLGSLVSNYDVNQQELMKAQSLARVEATTIHAEFQKRLGERYQQMHLSPEEAKMGMVQGRRGPIWLATKDTLREMGPAGAMQWYVMAKFSKGKLPGVMASIPDLALELSKEQGGAVVPDAPADVHETPEQEAMRKITWAQVAAMANIGQLEARTPFYARQALEAAKKKHGLGGK